MSVTTGTQALLSARTNRAQPGSMAANSRSGLPAARVNVGPSERQLSIVAGAAATVLGIARRDLPGLLMAGLGAGLLYRGASGHCSVYSALGVDSRSEEGSRQPSTRVEVVESFLIDKPAEELYRYWRQLENLPTIMSHLESVEVTGDQRSRWVAQAPMLAGGHVTWESEIVEDRPNERIAWRSLEGADVDNEGSVEFQRAPGDRGTIVRVTLKYAPPAGKLGSLLARLFGENPESQIREDLRRFKRQMEIGENVTVDGQSRGACFAGVGRLMS